MPIPVPEGVSVEIAPGSVSVTGPRGTLRERISPDITVAQEDGRLVVTRPTDRGQHRSPARGPPVGQRKAECPRIV